MNYKKIVLLCTLGLVSVGLCSAINAFNSNKEAINVSAELSDTVDYTTIIATNPDFPSTTDFDIPPANAWKAENGNTCFLNPEGLTFHNPNIYQGGNLQVYMGSTATKHGDAYVHENTDYVITFNMKKEKLCSINFESKSMFTANHAGFYSDPHVHSINNHVNKVNPTCEQAGCEEYYTCSCGAYFEDELLQIEIEDFDTWKAKDGDGYIAPLGHDLQIVNGKEATCLEDGWKSHYKCTRCEKHYEDEQGTKSIGDETAYNAWKLAGGKIGKLGHDIDKVNGTPATEDSDGFKDAYKCNNCGKYFEDEAGTKSIGDETAYNAWKLAGGKIGKLSHDIVKVSGSPATADSDGFKDAYKCKNCGKYFEDKEGTKSIGDETAYDAWKVGEGKIPALNPNNGKSANGGAIAGIIIGSFFGLLLIAFIVLYILWKLKDIRIPLLEKILTPAYRWINNLLFKTKLNNVEKKDAEEKHMSDEDYLKAQK